MIIEETFVINAPLETVWDFFFDLDRMSACIPGAELKQIDATHYEGAIKVKVGPLSAQFGGAATITQQEKPNRIEATINAKDRLTSSLTEGRFSSELTALSDQQTQVSYAIDVIIRGKLGQMAQPVVKGTAQKISAQFLKCAKAQLEA